MMKSVSFILLLTLTVACGKGGSGGGGSSEAEAVAPSLVGLTPEKVVSGSKVPEAAQTFETSGVDLMSMSAKQEAKMKKALEVIRLVIATEEFRKKVLNHKFLGKKTFVDNGGLTNAEIYQKILEGAEKFKLSKNNTMDMGVEMYSDSSNTVGYTYPSATQIWVNTKYFNAYTAAGVAHNLMHEWLHKLGFKHSATANASRPFSVPYAIGYIMMDIGKDFL